MLRTVREAFSGTKAGGPVRTIALAVAMIVAAAIWIIVAPVAFGMINPRFRPDKVVGDLVPIIVIAVVGTWIGSRRAQYLERTLAALRASEARSRELIEESGDGILVSEASGRYIEVNPALCRMLGYSREQLLAMQAGDLTAVDDPVGNAGMDERLVNATDEAGILVERRYRKRDGTSLPVEVRFRALPDGRVQRNVRGISERMHAEESLRNSEERMRGSLNAMLDPFVVCSAARDAQGAITAFRIDFANRAAGTFMRRGADTLIGSRLPEAMPDLGSTRFVEVCRRVVETGEGWAEDALEFTVPGRDGAMERRTVNIEVSPFGDGFFTVWRDVTEHERLARERERLVSIVEQSPDGIIITDYPELRITDANAAFAEDLGWTPADLVGRSVLEVVDGVLAAQAIAKLLEVARSGQPWLGEVERRLADGTVGPVQIRVTPRRAADGALEGYVVVTRDVSELRQAEAERARLAAAVEQAADYVIVNDLAGLIEAVNPAFERLTGHAAADVLGRPVASVLRSGVDPPEVYATLDAAVSRGEVWTGRLLERRADGSLLDADVSVSPIRDATGRSVGSVEIGRDRTHERELEAEREREAQIRVALAESLAHVPPDATLEQAAQAICDELVRLPFVDVAEVEIFVNDKGVEMLAVAAPPGYPAIGGTRLPAPGAARVRERTAGGPWAGYVTDDPADGFIPGAHAAGLRALAYGPIVHGGQVRGALVLGTFDERLARTLVETMPGVVSFSATSSALLGERMQALRREHDLRASVATLLDDAAFHPVFQPIVDLASGEVVGYEALTRFDSGQRPDLCFADAWSVGLGEDLEIATLEAAAAAGKALPPGRWIDLNLSPRLLADPERLRAVLRPAARPIVLEITEHDVIDDYGLVREAVRNLGHDVRLAVDDAGAGIANFGHIIELRPDLVKLDISLVRGVNANLERQAMVVGMRHFARTAGCRLIAEGVETEDEARTLTGLGVEFGQGYLFGHPERVEVWIEAEAAHGRVA
jgi:PAS domain S-box-containing protein